MSYSEPPPPPPPTYGQPTPAYGGGQPPKTSVMAIIGLVVGILGVFPCCGCGVFSIGAIVLGMLGKKEIAESNGAKKGEGMAKWAFILGIVGLVMGVIYWILVGSGTIDTTYSSDFSSN